MSYDALIGILIGSGISILVTYITHRFTEERETQKIDIEREKEAISEIYSPLVFVLDKTRNLFAGIVALHNTFEKMSETKEKPEEAVFILNYFMLENSKSYPQVLEDLLMHKSGLIESSQFYADLVVFQSYLSTIVSFLGMLVLRSNKKPIELKRYLSALAPLIIQLDEAISKMRQYSLAKTTRLSRYEYNQYFTEEKYSELEGYIDEVNKAMTGQYVLDWPLHMKRLIQGKIDKKTRKKPADKE
jgi:hypothetical protein